MSDEETTPSPIDRLLDQERRCCGGSIRTRPRRPCGRAV